MTEREKEPGNLPVAVDRFVGREREVDALMDVMREGLTLVTGLPGAGKTLTTIEAARRLLGQNAIGEAWFVDLVPHDESTDLVRVIAEVTGVVSRLEGDDPTAQLARILAGRNDVLVILDNAEHCLRSVAEIASSLAVEEIGVAVTSRVSDERFELFELSAMPTESDGVDLFVERMSRYRPLHEISSDERSMVSDIVDLVDGLPLGITLAAARTEIFDIPTLRDRLRESAEIIAGGTGGLEETFAWSWNLLDDHARHALTQCTVFRGSFDMAAAEAILDADKYDVVDVIHRLRKNSLLSASESQGRLRLRLLPSLAEFVSDRGSVDDDCSARHRDYFAELADRLGPALQREEAPTARVTFRLETENLIAAFRGAVAHREAERARRILEALNEFLSQRGALAVVAGLALEYLDGLQDDTSTDTAIVALIGCTALSTLGDLERGAEMIDRAEEIAAPADDLLKARVAYRAGWFTWISGDAVTALRRSRQARELAERSDDTHWIARTAWLESAIRQSRAEDLETVIALSEAAIEGQQKLGNLRFEGLAWSSLAVAQTAAGESTVDAHRRALSLFERVGDQMNRAKSMSDLAGGLYESGERDEAERFAKKSRDLARRCGLHWIDYLGTSTIVHLAIEREDWTRCDAEWKRLEETSRLARQPTFDLYLVETTALRAWKRDGAAEAAAIVERALPRIDRAFDISVPLVLVSLGAALRQITGTGPADPLLEKGRALIAEGTRTTWSVRLLDVIERFCQLDGSVDAAEEFFTAWLAVWGPAATGGRPFWLREITKVTTRHLPAPLKGACEWLLAHSTGGVAFYHPGKAWVRAPEGEWFDIAQRQQLTELLALLTTTSAGATPDEIRERLWPDEQMHPKSAKNRLHAAISMLRKTGMPVAYDGETYRLDCDLVLLRSARD